MNLKQVLRKNLPESAYPSYLTEISKKDLRMIAHAKRFKERYTADPAFREQVAIDSRKAAKKYHINIDPEEIRPAWDPVAGELYSRKNLPLSRLMKLCIAHYKVMNDWSTRYKDGKTIPILNFKIWRQQQIARSNSEMGEHLNSKIVHAPVCFELSSGCTVGCWFCAISADKFKGAFTYTPENRLLWKEVLEVVRDITGASAGSGFCYWGTDPMDNPDYEKFIQDYHSIIGSLPATNTAMAHKHIPRIKSLIHMWKHYGFTCNHLSILTVNILNQIHKEFTAEELVWTDLNLVNKDSFVKKVTAGRARERLIKLSQKSEEYQEIKTELGQGTIACISGFLFNMVEKTVKLISPCKADERWPKGYMILNEGTFTCGEDLKTLLEGMIKKNMPLSIPNNKVVKFRTDLQYKPLSNGFELVSEYQTQKIENPGYGKELGELIQKGSHTVDEILETITKLGATRDEIYKSIDILFKNGLLDN